MILPIMSYFGTTHRKEYKKTIIDRDSFGILATPNSILRSAVLIGREAQ